MAVVGWDRLRQEPYRLLFPLGIVFGYVGGFMVGSRDQLVLILLP